MYQPLVSIIIPVYNGANYVENAINCALNQTYPNLEILVVNDGSCDDGATDRAVEKYLDRVRYIKKENGGVSTALNEAIRQMRGEWFSWLSHDDAYYPQKIEKNIEAINYLLENEKTPKEKIVIYGANERIDKDGNVILRRRYSITNRESCIDLVLNNIKRYLICGCAVLVHRDELLKIGGFNEKIRTVSDAECFYRLLFDDCRFYFLNEVLVQSRQHKNQVGKKKAQLFQDEGDDFHCWMLGEILKRDEWRTPEILLRFIEGVSFRGYPRATQLARERIQELFGKGKYSFRIKCIVARTSIKRRARLAVRSLYRRIVVK